MKNILLILILLLLEVLNTFSKEKYDTPPPSLFFMVRPKYEMLDNNNWKNYSVDFGLSLIYESKPKYSKKEKKTYIGFIDTDVDFFHLGFNFKTRESKVFDKFLDFSLLNIDGFFKLFSHHWGLDFKLKLLNINSNLLFDEKYNWFNLGLGYGYDFINSMDNRLVPTAFIGIGYSSYKLDKNTFNQISNSLLKFSNMQFNTGLKLNLMFNPIQFDVVTEYTIVVESKPIYLFSLGGKLRYMFQKKLSSSVNYFQEDYYYKYFDIYLSCDYNKVNTKNLSQEILRFSTGIDIYIDFMPSRYQLDN